MATRRRSPLKRKPRDYLGLDPAKITDEVEGGCIAYVSTKTWTLEFSIQLRLDRLYDDRDFDAEALCRGLWMGYDQASRRDGWILRDARITQNTLTVRTSYRKSDARRLRQMRQVRIAPAGNIITPVAGVLLEVRDLRFI